MLTVSPRF